MVQEYMMEMERIASDGAGVQATSSRNRLDLEMQRDQAKDQTLEILHQIVHHPQPFRILAILYVHQ